MTGALLIRGGRLGDVVTDVLVLGGRIAALGPDAVDAAPPGVQPVDADGLIVAPGFIDLQVNGAAGHDFTREPAAIWSVGVTLARHGVTAFLATIVTAPPGAIVAALEAWTDGAPDGAAGALPLGLHLEGPYLSEARRGAHPSEYLRQPDRAEPAGWSRKRGVRLVTLAPEVPGALQLVADLSSRGVVVSAGHSAADAAIGAAAIEAGVRYGTHLFNAMPQLHHREPGLAGALLADERVTVGLICDGLHVAPSMLDLAWRAVGPGRFSVVSDVIAALGMPSRRVPLGNAEVIVEDQMAHLEDGTLAGAVAGLDAGLRQLVAATGCTAAQAIATVTSVPARLLGLGGGRGTIRAGGRADLALLTDELEVAATLVGGRVAHAMEPDRWA
ncbi:MAG: N-acetylglucosamine-6-phosphate deacetylase [Candidatus Limnocylindria bacterium]